jgi:hypothetical protein
MRPAQIESWDKARTDFKDVMIRSTRAPTHAPTPDYHDLRCQRPDSLFLESSPRPHTHVDDRLEVFPSSPQANPPIFRRPSTTTTKHCCNQQFDLRSALVPTEPTPAPTLCTRTTTLLATAAATLVASHGSGDSEATGHAR